MIIRAWDKQEGESDPAWEAFVIYRDLHEARSLVKVADQLGKSNTLIERWSRGKDWVPRVRLFDIHEDQEQVRLQFRERIKMSVRHANLATALQAKVAERLAAFTPEEVLALTPKQIADWLEIGVKVERLARGEVTERVGHADSQSEMSEHEIEGFLADDESSRLLDKAAARAEQLESHPGSNGSSPF